MSLESDDKETKRVVEPVDVDDCVVFLELLANHDDERGLVKLRCRHLFHLDCIGSYFNFKTSMEFPCCRQIEKGQWLLPKPIEASFPSFPVSPTMVWSDDVVSSVESHIATNPPMHRPYVPIHPPFAPIQSPYASNEIPLNDNMMSMSAAIVCRLHAMKYEYYGITGRTGIGGESSGGNVVAEEVAAGEAAGGAEMMEE
ncbi:PREDICTED: uncharacterized protein LOC109126857 [Camelina sativa]|uniref:Uncharacterized protein LOC109126857 n=1 Tax=Camelina sativa TaxID=90675 RepID=A0ABM1QHQ0_CAMSA|nr:PREDICTED: uncharacterized protein LOC109126857 [Camelina sativa]